MITLLGSDCGWRELLRQIGIPFRVGGPDRSTRLVLAPDSIRDRELRAALAAAGPDCELLKLGRLPAPGKAGTRVFGDITPHPVVERVGCFDRGELRRSITRAMRRLLNRHGLPLPHLAFCPGSSRSALAFRVDTDYCGEEELLAVRRLADAAGMGFTWFINTEAHGSLLSGLARVFEGQDVQVHCHRHEVYRSRAANRQNLATALEILRKNGHRPTGVASPYGDWNPGWDAAVAELGLTFASDFVAGWDDLPFRPAAKNRLSAVIQIPVHPVCLGRLRAARATDDDILRYYRAVILRQKRLREPCLLYDHPTGLARDSGLMIGLLREARDAADTVLTFSELGRWWLAREQSGYSVTMTPEAVTVEASPSADKVELELELEDRFARIPLQPGRYQLVRLEWQPLDDPGPGTKRPQRLSLRRRLGERLRRLRRQRRISDSGNH